MFPRKGWTGGSSAWCGPRGHRMSQFIHARQLIVTLRRSSKVKFDFIPLGNTHPWLSMRAWPACFLTGAPRWAGGTLE